MEMLVERVADEIQKRMSGEGSGHDWWHIFRVWTMAKRIGIEENANMPIVELGALLHDVADWKFTGSEDDGPREARALLMECGASEDVIVQVRDIVATISYKGAGVATPMATLEGKIVQDADRLDAMGAIGVARAFAYGGHKNRVMYEPGITPAMHATKEAYMNAAGTTVNHFYEKLLLLKDRMNTESAKKIAIARHAYLEQFLEEFFAEWKGKK